MSSGVAGALEELDQALGRYWLVGGAVRDALLSKDVTLQDLDVMCSRGALQRLMEHSPGRNRHGNVRLFLGCVKVDVFSPETFFRGFPSLNRALEYFDLSINALAVSNADHAVADPLQGIEDLARGEFRINEARWSDQNAAEEQAILRARLLKILIRYSRLQCVNPEIALVNLEDLFLRFPEVVNFHTGLPADEGARLLRLRLLAGDATTGSC